MFYDCNVYKPISAEPQRLQDLEEAVGTLLRVTELEGFAVAVFAWGAVSLPAEMAGKLQGFVGKRVGIIRLDGQYRAREV